MSDRRECQACHRLGYDVSPKVVRLDDDTYQVQLRCMNTADCRDRADAREGDPNA